MSDVDIDDTASEIAGDPVVDATINTASEIAGDPVVDATITLVDGEYHVNCASGKYFRVTDQADIPTVYLALHS